MVALRRFSLGCGRNNTLMMDAFPRKSVYPLTKFRQCGLGMGSKMEAFNMMLMTMMTMMASTSQQKDPAFSGM